MSSAARSAFARAARVLRPRLDDPAHAAPVREFLWAKCRPDAVAHPDELRVDEYFARIRRDRFVHPLDLPRSPPREFEWTAELIDPRGGPFLANLQAVSRQFAGSGGGERRSRLARAPPLVLK